MRRASGKVRVSVQEQQKLIKNTKYPFDKYLLMENGILYSQNKRISSCADENIEIFSKYGGNANHHSDFKFLG